MAKKGILWLPVAIGIILLAEILIFSLAFNKATVFSREVTDANVIFEGSELETYVRSIDDSIQISLAQALYNFYEAHKGETWESYGSNSVPDPSGEVSGSAQVYEGIFFTAHQNIPDKAGQSPLVFNPSDMGTGILSIGDKGVSMKFPQIEISKHFSIADFKRTFIPESTLATSFGEMMGAIQKLISSKAVDDQVLQAIGPSKGNNMKTSCGTADRFTDTTIRKLFCTPNSLDPIPYPEAGTTPTSAPQDACTVDGVANRELHSYLVDDAMTPKANQKFAGMSVDTQTQSTGSVRYCNLDKFRTACSCSDPCHTPPGFDPTVLPVIHEPTPDQVHKYSHGQTFSEASGLIQQHLYTRMICLEGELDYASTDYTAAFDGENGGLTINKDTISTKAQVDVLSDSNVPLGGECKGVYLNDCGRCTEQSNKILWKCPFIYQRTDTYNHVASVSLDARFQDDGFVYGFSALKSAGGAGHGGQVADTIKLLFHITTGNKQLI